MRIRPKTLAGRTGVYTAFAMGIILFLGMMIYSWREARRNTQEQAKQITGRFVDYLGGVRLIMEDISESRQRSIVTYGESGDFGPGIIWSVAQTREAHVDAVALYEADQDRGNTEDIGDWIDKRDLPLRVGLDYRDALNSHTIPEGLRKEFEDMQFSLPQNPIVEERSVGWLITDRSENKEYTAREEEGSLVVYDLRNGVSKKEFRSNIRSDYRGTLDRGIVSEDLRQAFRINGILLSQDTIAEKKTIEWVIADKDKDLQYFVREGRGKLIVYQINDEEPRIELRVVEYPGVSNFLKPILYVACPIDNPKDRYEPWKIFLRIGIPRSAIASSVIPTKSIFLLSPDDQIIAADKLPLIKRRYDPSIWYIEPKYPIPVGDSILGYVVVRSSIWPSIVILLLISSILGYSIFVGVKLQIDRPINRLVKIIEGFAPAIIGSDGKEPPYLEGESVPEEFAKVISAFSDMGKRLSMALLELHEAKERELALAIIGELGHAMKNNIGCLKGWWQIIKESRSFEGSALKSCTYLERELDVMSNLCQDLSYLRDVLGSEYELEKKGENINDILRSIIRRRRHDLENKRFTEQLDGSLPEVSSYVLRETSCLGPILENILDNAIWSIDQSKGEIGSIHVITQLSEDGNLAVIQVIDNGIGIDDHIKDKIFRFFFSGRAVNSGTGIGLGVAKVILEHLGGDIAFENNTGETSSGCTFTVRVPVYQI